MTKAAEAKAPQGLSVAGFKSSVIEAGGWLWGTTQGAFNEKQSISQMVVDAGIGMIPVVGEVTAVRDIIAVVIGLCDDPRKREDKFQWMLLVVLIFALIPVIGGVIKGIGRLSIHTMKSAARAMEKGARSALFLEAARDMVALSNRVGTGNAEKWFKQLTFAKYQNDLIVHINELLVRFHGVFTAVERKMASVLPSSVAQRIAALKEGLTRMKGLVSEHIPEAIKQLDKDLREFQALIHSGGESTSRTVPHTARAGANNVSYTDELILMEGKGAMRSGRGGLVANSPKSAEASKWYMHEPGFPDLKSYALAASPGRKNVDYPLIATYAGRIVNREIPSGEKLYRVFGKGGTTHGVDAVDSFVGGSPARVGGPSFWGLGDAPTTAEEWRKGAAVLDEWNRNGYMVIGQVLAVRPLPLLGCTGLIAEQQGKKIGVQYLEGGAKQAVLDIPADVARELNDLGSRVQNSGRAVKVELWGIAWEIKPTHWQDANGIHGYLHMPGPLTVQTMRLGAREIATKREGTESN